MAKGTTTTVFQEKKNDGKAIKYKVAFLYTQPIERPGFEEKKIPSKI